MAESAQTLGEVADLMHRAWKVLDVSKVPILVESNGSGTTQSGDAHKPVLNGNPHWRHARWFGSEVEQRIVRQAALSSRKKKRVESLRLEDGTVMYSARDAHRWWPERFPDPEIED